MVLPTITETYEIPKEILKAEKMLKITYPEVYSKICQYRNSRYIEYFEWEKIKFRIERSTNFNLIKNLIFSFIGIKNEPVMEVEDEDKEIIVYKKIERRYNRNCVDPPTCFTKKHSYRKASK